MMEAGLSPSPLPAWAASRAGKRICIRTFGCTYNEGDSARLRDILGQAGCRMVEDPGDADEVILTTCVVIAKTERKMIRLIRDLTGAGTSVLVTGCLPLARGEILDAFPSVRILLPEEIHAASGPGTGITVPVAIVQAGQGCLGSCRYCITRVARGRIRSTPRAEICDRIRMAAAQGAAEIRLTGQDLSAYGSDLGDPSLPSLLEDINQMEGDFLVRLGMMNPATLAPVIHGVARALTGDHLFRFVHLPVQSGSDAILSRMNRGYTAARFLDLVAVLRSTVPGISIGTDIITGFPGETEEDFHQTCDLLTRVRPDMLHVTRYSYRPGSPISRDAELVDRVCKERSRALIRAGYAILKEKKQQMVGECGEVVITEQVRPGTVMGRTWSYQGVVISGDLPAGGRYRVRYTGERTHYLTGIIISPIS